MKCLCAKRQGKTSLSEEAVEGRATEGGGQAKECGTMRIRWAEKVNNENDCVYVIYLDNSCLDDLNPPGDTITPPPPLCPLNLCLLSDALVIPVRSRALWRVCTFKCSYLHALFGGVQVFLYKTGQKPHVAFFSLFPLYAGFLRTGFGFLKSQGLNLEKLT